MNVTFAENSHQTFDETDESWVAIGTQSRGSTPISNGQTESIQTSNIWNSGDDYYDIGAESPTLRTYGLPFMRDVLRHEPILSRRKGLAVDFGCWSGRHIPLLRELVSSKGRVKGLDHNGARKRLQLAQSTYGDMATFHVVDFNEPILSDSSADAGLCWRVLHNLTGLNELTSAIKHIHRALKPGAPFVASVRAVDNWMPPEAEGPFLHRKFQKNGEREDYYFSTQAAKTFFTLHGFNVSNTRRFSEQERVHGQLISNDYLLILATRILD